MGIRERLQKVFIDVFEEDIEIYDEMTAEDVEDWDSLTHIQLVVEIEKEFNVKFTTDEVLELKNVGEFITLLKKKLS